jgi:arachidonate 15-lipoxygenase
LARTHLVAELIAIATRRNLAARHPLHALLEPHWTGTAFINDRARKDLVANGGVVDRTFGATIDSLRAYAAEQLASYKFDEEKLSHRFEKRGTASLARYPFRDAALRIANVLRKWLTTYVNRWYPNDQSLTDDGEAQAWFEALAQPLSSGGVPGFQKPAGLADLVETLTLIIFLPSVQHAAVNFPQWTDMSWCAAFSGGLWAPLPPPSTATTDGQWLELLPPLPVALAQVELLYALGTVRYGILGQREAFGDQASDAALTQLRKDLATLEAEMLDKAKSEPRPYLTLLPSLIPRSINI